MQYFMTKSGLKYETCIQVLEVDIVKVKLRTKLFRGSNFAWNYFNWETSWHQNAMWYSVFS